MPISLAAALVLASRCAPSVAPETLLSVIQVESHFEPLAIGVNGASPATLAPVSIDDAVIKAQSLIAAGRNLDLGLAQINSRNLGWLGLTLPQVFDPCTNLAAAARILQADYLRSEPIDGREQAALRRALSFYNTGRPDRGFANGYVDKVSTAAARFVPALQGLDPSAGLPMQPRPQTHARPAWDVFGEVQPTASAFVTIVPPSAPGGSK